jgi:hypothetical protein
MLLNQRSNAKTEEKKNTKPTEGEEKVNYIEIDPSLPNLLNHSKQP